MCNCDTEDWRHVLMCGSIDASLHRAVSWGKLRKSMELWHLPQDFWTTIEKGGNHYTEQPHKRTTQSKENEPQKHLELHSTHKGTYYNKHSGHNHISDGTTFLRVESAGIV
jgi:hypothetical protein